MKPRRCKRCPNRLPDDSHSSRLLCDDCRRETNLARRRRWYKRHADEVRPKKREWDATQRRAAGMLTRAERTRVQQELAAKRLASLQPLLDSGLGVRAAARALGISHNIIVGLTYRQRQMEQQGQ